MHEHEHDHDHAHHHHHPVENERKLVIVIFLNVLITIAEFVGGILAGSLALVSDAWHNLSDVLALMLSYAGEKVSEIDPNQQFSFGFKRFEVLIALANSLSLLAIGSYIVYEAVDRFLNPQPISIGIMLPVAVVGLAGNFISMAVLMRNRESGINMRAAFLHLLYDALSSVGVIAAALLLYFTGWMLIDIVISLGIVVMMVWSSTDIIKESLRIFLQGTPRGIDAAEVYRSMAALYPDANVHGLHIWSINSKEIFLSCHICLRNNEINLDTDRIIREVNNMLRETYGIEHTALQIENNQICSLESGRCCS